MGPAWLTRNRLAGATLTLLEGSYRSCLSARESWRHGVSPDSRDESALAALRRDGIVIVPGYYDPDRCRELRDAIDAHLDDPAASPWIDEQGSDHRIYGLERIDADARRFFSDRRPHAVGEAYCRCSLVNAFTLAGRVDYRPGNAGSGGGWHRDSFSQQFKALVYLDDVSDTGGPFQYIRGSASVGSMVRHLWRGNLGFRQNRIPDAVVQRILEPEPDACVTARGDAGTLVLFDARGIHRGKPIQEGRRHALTNYYMARTEVTPAVAEHFNTHVAFADGAPLSYDEIMAFRPEEVAEPV